MLKYYLNMGMNEIEIKSTSYSLEGQIKTIRNCIECLYSSLIG